jgi:DNA-directed RNA polymerase subunit RPC12/RpoP
MLPEGPRKPRQATLTGTPGDRRLNRLKQPPCTACGHPYTGVVLRTNDELYIRCEYCERICVVAKPGHERQFGT